MEFDDINKVIVTRSHGANEFKLWRYSDYTLAYTLLEETAEEIRIAEGIILLIYPPNNGWLNLKVLDITDGTFLNAYNVKMKQGQSI